MTNLNTEIVPKRLELLRQVLPAATNLALLGNPLNPGTERQTSEVLLAARRIGVNLSILNASTDRELVVVLDRLRQLAADGVVIGADNFFNRRMEELAALALRYRTPAIFQFREFATAGGLMSYGAN